MVRWWYRGAGALDGCGQITVVPPHAVSNTRARTRRNASTRGRIREPGLRGFILVKINGFSAHKN